MAAGNPTAPLSRVDLSELEKDLISTTELNALVKPAAPVRFWNALSSFASENIAPNLPSSISPFSLFGAKAQTENEKISSGPSEEHKVEERSEAVIRYEKISQEAHVDPSYSLLKTGKELGIKLLETGMIAGGIVGLWYGVQAYQNSQSAIGGSVGPLMNAIKNNDKELAIHILENIKSLADMAINAINAGNTEGAIRVAETLQSSLSSVLAAASNTLETAFIASSFINPVLLTYKELVSSTFLVARKDAKLTPMEATLKTYKKLEVAFAEDFKKRPKEFQDTALEIDKSVEQDAAIAIKQEKETGVTDTNLLNQIKLRMTMRFKLLIARPDKNKECERWKTDAGTIELMNARDRKLKYLPKEGLVACTSFITGTIAASIKNVLPATSTYDKYIFKNDKGIAVEFDRDTRDELFTRETKDTQNWHVWSKVPENRKRILNLVGEPGLGKSQFLQTVADLSGRPVIRMVRPVEREGGYQLFYPKKWKAIDQKKFLTAIQDLLGEIGLAQINSGYGNAIISIDEADGGDLEGLKRVTDTATVKILNFCMGAYHDFRNDIILGSNYFIKNQPASNQTIDPNEIDHALDDRMNTVHLKQASWEAKWAMARDAYHDLSAKFCLPFEREVELPNGSKAIEIAPPKLLNERQKHETMSEQDKLQTIFKEHIDHLVTRHHKKIPGMRMDVPVDMIVNYMVDRMLDCRLRGAAELTSDEVLKVIDDFYDSKPDRNPYALDEEKKENEDINSEKDVVLVEERSLKGSGSTSSSEKSSFRRMDSWIGSGTWTRFKSSRLNPFKRDSISEERVGRIGSLNKVRTLLKRMSAHGK